MQVMNNEGWKSSVCFLTTTVMWMYFCFKLVLESSKQSVENYSSSPPIVWCYQSGVDDLFFKANKECAKVKIQRCNSPSLSPILVFQFFPSNSFTNTFKCSIQRTLTLSKEGRIFQTSSNPFLFFISIPKSSKQELRIQANFQAGVNYTIWDFEVSN